MSVSRLRLGLGVLMLAGSLLAVFWVTRGWEGGPPIYDGLPLQTEPYRYLQPSPGQATTGPPSSASESVKLTQNFPFIVSTSESPPQAELQANPDSFVVPQQTQGLTISVTPIPPAAPIPNGRLDGNVYRISVTLANGATVGVAPGKHVTVYLRGTGAQGKTVMDRFSGGRWTPLPTQVPGGGFHAADSDQLGDFALVLLPGGAGGLSGGARAAIAVAIFVVVIGLVLALVRRLRR